MPAADHQAPRHPIRRRRPSPGCVILLWAALAVERFERTLTPAPLRCRSAALASVLLPWRLRLAR